MARTAPSRAALWIWLAVVALIAYGSLYPFNFIFDGKHPNPKSALLALSWARAGKADQVRNIILYLPFGFCLMLWLRGRVPVLFGVVMATMAGAVCSLFIELAQVYLFIRVPSWLDVSLNAFGALLGAVFGLVWRQLSGLVYLPPNTRREAADRSALVVIVSWVLWRLAPLDLNFSLTRFKQALLPLINWQIDWLDVGHWLVLWLVVAQAVYGFAQRARSNEVLLSVMAVVFLGRMSLVTPPFSSAELLALLLLLPTLVLLHRFLSAPQRWVVFIPLALMFVQSYLTPWQFGSAESQFDFWPFMAWIQQGMPVDPEPLLHTLFAFSAMIWLLKDVGLPMRHAWWSVTALVLLLEIVQLWMPGRHASITDPALAFLTGWLMHVVSNERRKRQRGFRYR